MVRRLIKHRRLVAPLLHSKIVWQFRILVFILFLFVCVLSYDLYAGVISLVWLVAGLVLGGFIGVLAARMFKMQWKDDKIVSSMDRIGVIVLVAYLVFSVSKSWLFGHWLNGASLSSFGFSIVAGIMAGRLVSMSRQVESLLKARKIA